MTNLPVSGSFRITCEYHRRGKWAAGHHTGIDIVSYNRLVYGTCNGVVHRVGFDKSYGNFIVVYNESDDTYHWFCHLAKYNVKVGDKINRSRVIGVMGSTGNSTGVHLHFEIRLSCNKYDMTSNPATYMGVPNKVGYYHSDNFSIDKVKSQVGDSVYINCKFTGATHGDIHTSLIEVDSDIPFVGSIPKQIWVYDSTLNDDKTKVKCLIAHDSGDRFIVELDTENDSASDRQIWVSKGGID